jgi:hypothetical protein
MEKLKIMNDTFNIKRFGWVLRKSILERPAQIVGLTLVTLVITLLIYAIVQNMAGIAKAQICAFAFGILVGGSFISSYVLGYFSSNSTGISFLMLPASHLEKWLSAVLVAGIFFTGLYLGFYRFIDIFFVNSYHNKLDPNGSNYQALYHSVEVFAFDNQLANQIFILFANISGAMILGSLYFNKVSYIKVALLICTVVFGTYFLNLFIANQFFDQIDMAMPFRSLFLNVGSEVGIIDLPNQINDTISITISYVIPAALWVTAYIRLDEKET